MRRRRVLLLLALAAATFALPRRRRLRWPSRRRRKKMWTRATRRAARSLEASVSEVRDLLLSTREDRRDLAGNALAGLASAVAVVPEASQFALIAGAHPLVGLGSTVAVGASCALFGGRPGMVSGASATCALVLKPLVESHGVEAMRVAVFVAGLLQLAVGLLKGGRLVRMVPQPVVLGFVNGLAVKVLRAQVDHFQFPHGTWLAGVPLLCHGALAALSFAVIEGAPARLTRFCPAPLLAMGLCSALARWRALPVPLLADVVGAFDGGAESLRLAFLPRYDARAAVPWLGRAPSRALVAAALPCAVELAAVGLLQSLLTLQLVDGLTRDGPDGRGRASRECRALGAGNAVAGFCGGMGGCGLLGQSLVNLSSGGAARASAVFYVAFVFGALAAGGALLGALPVAALVGLMLAVAKHTFSWSSLRLLGRCRAADAATILLVSALTATRGLALAVASGIVATCVRFAYDSANDLYSSHEAALGVRTVDLHGTLFFGSAAAFKDHAAPTDRDRAYARSWRRRWVKRVVVLDFLQCRVCDASAIAAINDAVDAYRDLGLTVVLRHLSRDAALFLRAASTRADVVFDERDDDPSYYVAATTPDGLGQPKQGQTVVVEPADEGKGAP